MAVSFELSCLRSPGKKKSPLGSHCSRLPAKSHPEHPGVYLVLISSASSGEICAPPSFPKAMDILIGQAGFAGGCELAGDVGGSRLQLTTREDRVTAQSAEGVFQKATCRGGGFLEE